MKHCGGLSTVLAVLALAGHVRGQAPPTSMAGKPPLEIARVLAAKYPAQPIMSYIPALSWSGQLRLSASTGEAKWRDKALKDIQTFTSGTGPTTCS